LLITGFIAQGCDFRIVDCNDLAKVFERRKRMPTY
jgi:hypothetical protein